MTEDIAARVLAELKDVEAEVLVSRQDFGLTRFANSFIHQNVADDTTSVRLRVHAGGRTATTSTTIVAGDGLRDLVGRTVEALRTAPADPSWPGLPGPMPALTGGTVDGSTEFAEPGDRAARVRAFVDAAEGLEAAGYCRTSTRTVTYANTAGQLLSGATSEAAMDGVARTGSSDGVARMAAPGLSAVDGAVLGARAAAKARAGADPVELPPGMYEVVLEPAAVGDLLEGLGAYAFNAKAFAERRSCLRLGEDQFDRAVTIVDDPVSPGTTGLPFDVEGTPRQVHPLITAGFTAGLVHDRRTAAQAGTASTGHGSGSASWGPTPAHLKLLTPAESTATAIDGPAADSSVAALVEGVERGLLVTDFWYTRVLDPRTLVITGLTRNGVWLIEDGKITTPVRNFRFTQSYADALAPGQVLAVGSAPTGLPMAQWGSMSVTTPALRLAGWKFTGGASG